MKLFETFFKLQELDRKLRSVILKNHLKYEALHYKLGYYIPN